MEFLEVFSHKESWLIVLNLILIESLLSVDNAAILAAMVMRLPEHQRQKALRYGIIGAYVFRGICLVFAFWLMQIWWLKTLGGLYLTVVGLRTLLAPPPDFQKTTPTKKWGIGFKMSLFWRTVIWVELADIAFSLDNVFAAVSFSDELAIIMVGVFIGILTMRFVAGWFVRLISLFPALEAAAATVIVILGLKLLIGSTESLLPPGILHSLVRHLESSRGDLIVSLISLLIFSLSIPLNPWFKRWKQSQKQN